MTAVCCAPTRSMIQHNVHDILVVSPEGKLVGIASRVDVGRAILTAWSKVEKK